MMRFASVIAQFDNLSEAELAAWIARDWVHPAEEQGEHVFAEIDLARIRLIHDLRHAMAVPDDTLPLVLSLLDQLHALRGTIGTLAEALGRQPPEIQEIIRAAIVRRS